MKALSAAASVVRHASGAAAEALLLAAIVAALALALSPLYGPARTITGAGGVDAGKGATGNSIVVVGSAAARSIVMAGDSVTTLSTLGRDYYLVYVRATCSLDGAGVYERWVNIKTGDWTTDGYATFDLPADVAGAACDADLLSATMKGGHRIYTELATVSFTAL